MFKEVRDNEAADCATGSTAARDALAALAKALADSGSEFDGMNAALKTELGKRLFGLMNSQSISGTGRVSVNPLDGPALVGLLEPSLQTCRGSRSA